MLSRAFQTAGWRLFAEQVIGTDQTLAFDIDQSTLFKVKAWSQALEHGLAGLYATRHPGGLHPAGQIDGITPDIVEEAFLPNHACDGWPAMHANAKGKLETPRCVVLRNHGLHGQRQVGHGIWFVLADCHVGITDRLDLFNLK